MGELLDALNARDERAAPDDRPRKWAIDQAAEAVDKAIEACREPGMPLYTLSRWVRRTPMQALAIVTCHRSFIQQQLESRGYVRHAARVEQRAIGGAGRGCAADRPLR
jgi:hypothetical protein